MTDVGEPQCLPGEDFSFMTDPAYYAYLVEAMLAENPMEVAQSMSLLFPMEV
jgi:hypothetical protein